MSPLDASFLHIEDGVQHMHLGSIGILEGPAPGREELLAALAGKLALVPRYRQKVRFVPLALGRPVWVDDPHFRLDYHVRRTALPAPGGEGELRDLVGRVTSPYDGGLNFGLTGDSEHAPDLDVLAHGIEAEIAELLATTERLTPAPTAVSNAEPAPAPG